MYKYCIYFLHAYYTHVIGGGFSGGPSYHSLTDIPKQQQLSTIILEQLSLMCTVLLDLLFGALFQPIKDTSYGLRCIKLFGHNNHSYAIDYIQLMSRTNLFPCILSGFLVFVTCLGYIADTMIAPNSFDELFYVHDTSHAHTTHGTKFKIFVCCIT